MPAGRADNGDDDLIEACLYQMRSAYDDAVMRDDAVMLDDAVMHDDDDVDP